MDNKESQKNVTEIKEDVAARKISEEIIELFIARDLTAKSINRFEKMKNEPMPLELCIDHDHITISVSRFEKLVKDEIMLEIVRRAYEANSSFDLQTRLASLFPPLEKNNVGSDGNDPLPFK